MALLICRDDQILDVPRAVGTEFIIALLVVDKTAELHRWCQNMNDVVFFTSVTLPDGSSNVAQGLVSIVIPRANPLAQRSVQDKSTPSLLLQSMFFCNDV